MGSKCLSIEDDINFVSEFTKYSTIAFCYPIYGSRVPLIMRQFATRHASSLQSKKLVILVTQLIFSGDGARVFCDLFPKNHFDIIYAEHFFMPNNVCNFALLPKAGKRSITRCMKTAKRKVKQICQDISVVKIKKRGFSEFSRFLGNVQGRFWQGNSSSANVVIGSMEAKAKNSVQIDENCTVCGLCTKICPMKNLEIVDSKIIHKNNCTVCYRCVNLCPEKTITVFFHRKPKWQYKGILK
ncbi:MAG: EFR1 family ferrodoxin [Defluviitaleaceae bacterium]|nr:EFR1 family ferrodoxin [Defluviitaleaceae bacterium]